MPPEKDGYDWREKQKSCKVCRNNSQVLARLPSKCPSGFWHGKLVKGHHTR